jgi:arylsulfatase A-like enzyme
MESTPRQPNIILINCDDLGYGDLGCYGSDVNQTPALDQMAAEGTRLTNFYMASPVCSPSRAAMLTGSYPTRIGFGGAASGSLGGVLFPGWGVGLNPDEITIAKLLKSAGYATQLIGKWRWFAKQAAPSRSSGRPSPSYSMTKSPKRSPTKPP